MNSNPDAIDATTRFLGGGGDAGARLRSFDWSSSTLGSPVGWPQALRTMVSVMLASTQPMFLAWGSEGVYLYNDAYAPLIGAKHPSAFGRRFLDMWSEARSQLEPLVDAVFVGEPVIMDDIALALERDGRTEEAHYSFSYTPIRDEAGEVAGLFGVCLETTDRIQSQRREAEAKKALEASERQLQEANASLQRHKAQLESEVAQRTSALISANAALNQAVVFNRTVTDMIPARISYCDADLICRFANGPFSEWLGKQPGEVEGQAVTSLFPSEALAEVRRYLDGALQGIPQRFEGHSRRPDGSIAFSQVDFIPEAPTDASQRPGIFALAIDITKLKKAEQALLALNADLANSRDQARDASRAKSAFLANMSHEIRTPLNAILGMTHIMTRHVSDAAQIDRLGKVRTAAQHLRSLIDGVLDLSKIEAGKLVLDAAPFKPAAVISEAMSMLRGTADQKGLRFASERVDVPAVLVGDSLRLTQMLINLLSNAVKFTDSGGVTLRCEVAARSEGRCQLRFEIEDSGPGIDAAVQSKLFEAFEQVDTSITRRHGGTGLGLALTRQFARAMNGDIGVRSEPGLGSTFWFTAWFDDAADTGAETPASDTRAVDLDASESKRLADIAEAMLEGHHRGRRVLLAEDNEVNREVGIELMTAAGLLVDIAEDGRSAVELALTGRYDVVLMDVQMPFMDGLEATRVIRPLLPSLPIIAMTANVSIDDRIACLKAGMNDHLTKPIDPALLYATLMRYLDDRSPR